MTARLALLSVSDRTGLDAFARALVAQGFRLVSTGGTAQHLAQAGLAVTNVSDLTGFPEVFGGRVKTLHPKLFGGILFNRSEARDRGEAEAHGVGPIDLVVVNLYPFEETVAKGAALLAVYSAGLGIPFLLAAFAVEPCAAFIAHFKRHLELVEKTMGGLLVLTGIAFLTGFVSEASFYLLEWFPALGRIG